MRKKLVALILLAAIALGISGCGKTDMPFNGEVVFHEIAVTIPENFVRESTQSDDQQWLFESGWYQTYILLVCNDGNAGLEEYQTVMQARNCDSNIKKLNEMDCVISFWKDDDGNFRQEILFCHNGKTYAVMLHNGDDELFQDIIASIKLR